MNEYCSGFGHFCSPLPPPPPNYNSCSSGSPSLVHVWIPPPPPPLHTHTFPFVEYTLFLSSWMRSQCLPSLRHWVTVQPAVPRYALLPPSPPPPPCPHPTPLSRYPWMSLAVAFNIKLTNNIGLYIPWWQIYSLRGVPCPEVKLGDRLMCGGCCWQLRKASSESAVLENRSGCGSVYF